MIPVVVRTLSITESAVLVNATRLLAVCAKEGSCRRLVPIFSWFALQVTSSRLHFEKKKFFFFFLTKISSFLSKCDFALKKLLRKHALHSLMMNLGLKMLAADN